MKTTKSTPHNMATLSFDPSTGAKCDHIIVRGKKHRETTPKSSAATTTAEQDLTNRIFREGNGKGLIKFCRELAGIMIRQYSADTGSVGDLRTRLCTSLIGTLKCSQTQAQCLVDLSLELIHAKIHGRYRRTNVELSYLIATATGAVSDPSSN